VGIESDSFGRANGAPGGGGDDALSALEEQREIGKRVLREAEYLFSLAGTAPNQVAPADGGRDPGSS